MKKVRFIHTADLHLDSPFLGLKHLPAELFTRLQESTFAAFTKVVDVAIEKKVDFVVIVGDLYDGEDRSIKAQSRLRNQLERLKEHDIAAFISYGNHDHLAGDWLMLELPENVHSFTDKVEVIPYTTKSGVNVHLYGFSYPQRHVWTRKIEQYERENDADFHIALLHGQYEGGSTLHQRYAPFTINDLLQKKMDYWALGHVHQKEILHKDPHVVYPGNIQGRHRKETGRKGCYVVNLSEHDQTELEFIETADIHWTNLTIEAKERMSFTDFYTLCAKSIANEQKVVGQGQMVELTIKNVHYLSKELRKKIDNGELLDILQDEAHINNEFVWPYRLTYDTYTSHTKEQVLDEQFIEMLNETLNEIHEDEKFEVTVSDLYAHSYAGRYLSMEELNKDEVLHEAKKLIIDQLQKQKQGGR